jgi:DNA-binding CsgD family transcriptional regulator
MPESAGIRQAAPAGAVLADCAAEIYSDLRLMPLLRRLMNVSCRLTGASGGRVAIADRPGQHCTRIAERGMAGRPGQSSPLHEDVTGQVMARRQPVVLDPCRDVGTGHPPLDHPAGDGAVAAIPIWWRAEVVGVNVVLAGCARSFTTAEIDQLEMVTQLAAPGIMIAARRELPLAGLWPGGPDSPVQSPFSPREGQVATLLARGLSDRSIAHELLISRKTVEKHVGAILRKTGTSCRTAAVMRALEHGWLDGRTPAGGLCPGEISPSPPETSWV